MAEIGFKRKKDEKERDLAVISDLRLQGLSLHEIAAELPKRTQSSYQLTHACIDKDLKIVRKRWKEEQSKNMDKFITEQRASYRLIRKELYKRLAEATKEREDLITTTKEKDDHNGRSLETTKTKRNYDMMREVKILEAIQKNINDECNLVGDAIKLHLEMERQMIAEQISERYSSVGRVEMIPVESVDYEEIKNVVKQLPKGDE